MPIAPEVTILSFSYDDDDTFLDENSSRASGKSLIQTNLKFKYPISLNFP